MPKDLSLRNTIREEVRTGLSDLTDLTPTNRLTGAARPWARTSITGKQPRKVSHHTPNVHASRQETLLHLRIFGTNILYLTSTHTVAQRSLLGLHAKLIPGARKILDRFASTAADPAMSSVSVASASMTCRVAAVATGKLTTTTVPPTRHEEWLSHAAPLQPVPGCLLGRHHQLADADGRLHTLVNRWTSPHIRKTKTRSLGGSGCAC